MSATEISTFYDLLGLTPEATKEQIRDAYKEIARVYHPDSNFYDEIIGEVDSGLTPEQIETFKRITEAYNTLSNEERRAAYDRAMPKPLPRWEDSDPWAPRRGAPVKTVFESPKGPKSGAFGRFGVVNEAPRSAFDSKVEARPVSEMIRVKRAKESAGPGLVQKFLMRLGVL